MSGRRWWLALGAIALAGLLLRLPFLAAPGFPTDLEGYMFWAERAAARGPAAFYAPDLFCDYPPGSITLLWALGALLDGEPLRLAIKALSIPADLGIAVLVATWTRPRVGPARSLGAAGLWLALPATIFAGAYWGQLDALGTLAVLAAALAAGDRRWPLAGALAGLAGMLKLQFGLGGYVLLAAAVIVGWRARSPRAPLEFGLAALAVVLALGVPYRMGPFELVDLARRASETYPYTSLFAFNVWGLTAGFWVDDRPWFGLGAALLCAGLAASVIPLLWRRDTAALLACAALAAMSFYFLPTRAHERYLFPAFAYLLPLVAMRPVLLLAYLPLALGFLASFYAVFVPRGLITLPPALASLAVDRAAHIWLCVVMLVSAAALAVLSLGSPGGRWLPWARGLLGRARSIRLTSPQAAPPAGLGFARSREAWLMRIVVCAKVAGLILVFSTSGLSGFEQPKSSWSRAAAWLLVALLAIALARYGTRIVPRSPVHLAVAALVGATALSAVFAEHRYTALFGERTRYLGLSFTVDMAVLYAALAVAFRHARALTGLAACVGAAGAAAIGYGIIQSAGLDPVGWGRAAQLRPFATFGNPDMYGHFLAVLASGAAATAAFAGERRVRVAALAVALSGVALISIVATRGALIGLAAGLLVLAACVLGVRGRRALRPLAVAAGGLALVAAAGLIATPVGSRLLAIGGSPELADRLVIWDGAWRLFLQRPILGFGPDNLGVAFHLIRRPGAEAVHAGAVAVDQAHDWVLHALATTGVVGLLGWVALIAATVLVLRRELRVSPVIAAPLLAAFAAYWGQSLVSVEATSVSWMPWAIAGLAASRGTVPGGDAPVRRISALALAAICAVGLGLAASGQSAARANDAVARAAQAYERGDAAAATAAANEAIALDPGRGEHWNYRGLARALRGLHALAAADHEEAWRRTPHQTNYLLNLARSRAAQAAGGDASGGGAAAAYDAARRAVAIEPNLASTHRTLGEVALTLGDPDLALTESLVAMRLFSREPGADVTAAQAALKHPDRARARAFVQEALALRRTPVLESALRSLQ